MKRLLVFIVFICYMNASAQQWSGIIDPSRAVDWNAITPGVTTGGGIGLLPDAAWANCTTAACNILFAGTVTQTSIENALASCGTNQVVRIPAGTFTLGGWKNTQSNCVLRGSGGDQTFIILNNDRSCSTGISGNVGICNGSTGQNYGGNVPNIGNGPVSVTGTFPKGQTSVTFATVPNLKVGDSFMIDQTDDTTDTGAILISQSNSTITAGSPTCVSTSQIPPCGTTGPVSLEGNSSPQRTGREQMEVHTVVSCGGVSTFGSACSGSSVTVVFSPGLAMPNWNSANTPQAWWATGQLHNAGIENINIDQTGAGAVPGIGVANSNDFWVAGVVDKNTNRSHVQIDYSAHITVRDSYFFLTKNSISQSYGVECDGASNVLVENNIFQAVTSPLMINGSCSGSVYSYNYQINNYYTGSNLYNIPGTLDHTAGQDNILFEGNYGNAFTGDVFHGSHHFITPFRNRFTGPQPACQSDKTQPYASAPYGVCNNSLNVIQLLSYSRFYNFIGNILGTSGTNTNYSSGGSNTLVWDVGSGNTEGSVTVPDDPNVLPTMMRWGNCDSASGFSSCRFVSGEVPSALAGSQAAFSNPVPASNTLPASFYYSAKPAWWPSLKPWPAIGPDVTSGNLGRCTSGSFTAGETSSSGDCSGGSFSASTVGGHANTIPSQDCFLRIMGGNPWGTVGPFSFNAATCYPATVTSVSRVISGSHKLGGGRFVP